MSELYSADFERSIDREYTVEPVQKLFSKVKDQGILDQMLYIDTKTWLPDDLLIKADKMTMANSLELRVPLLDHRVLEFAAALPARLQSERLQPEIHIEESLGEESSSGDPEKEEGWFPGSL